MTKIEIRGPSGVGDAIYMNSITQAFAWQFEKVLVRTKFPEIFRYCKRVEPVQFKKGGADKEFNYGGKRRSDQSTTQWQDLLITAGLPLTTPYKTAWEFTNHKLIENIREKSKDKKILVMSTPHTPFNRLDKFGLELIPNYKKFRPVLERAKADNYFTIQIGRGKALFDFGELIDLNLTNTTSVCDILDVSKIGDAFAGQCGFIVPLAEGFEKPLFLIFARRGLNSREEFLSNITGQKICSTKDGYHVADDLPDELVAKEFEKCL